MSLGSMTVADAESPTYRRRRALFRTSSRASACQINVDISSIKRFSNINEISYSVILSQVSQTQPGSLNASHNCSCKVGARYRRKLRNYEEDKNQLGIAPFRFQILIVLQLSHLCLSSDHTVGFDPVCVCPLGAKLLIIARVPT